MSKFICMYAGCMCTSCGITVGKVCWLGTPFFCLKSINLTLVRNQRTTCPVLQLARQGRKGHGALQLQEKTHFLLIPLNFSPKFTRQRPRHNRLQSCQLPLHLLPTLPQPKKLPTCQHKQICWWPSCNLWKRCRLGLGLKVWSPSSSKVWKPSSTKCASWRRKVTIYLWSKTCKLQRCISPAHTPMDYVTFIFMLQWPVPTSIPNSCDRCSFVPLAIFTSSRSLFISFIFMLQWPVPTSIPNTSLRIKCTCVTLYAPSLQSHFTESWHTLFHFCCASPGTCNIRCDQAWILHSFDSTLAIASLQNLAADNWPRGGGIRIQRLHYCNRWGWSLTTRNDFGRCCSLPPEVLHRWIKLTFCASLIDAVVVQMTSAEKNISNVICVNNKGSP